MSFLSQRQYVDFKTAHVVSSQVLSTVSLAASLPCVNREGCILYIFIFSVESL